MSDSIIGKKFGNLTVLEKLYDRVNVDKSVDEMYKCECDCENHTKIIVSRQSLEKGYSTHCGCKMGGSFDDISGQKFGRLKVIDRAPDFVCPDGRKEVMWNCICDCGNKVVVRGHSLRSGHTKSCGCQKIDSVTIHGDKGTKLYSIWYGMKSNNSYCKDWEEYLNFKEWALKSGYDENSDKVLYVKDISLPHSPDNCVWMTRKEISNNRKNSKLIEYNGKTQTVTQWGEELGISSFTIFSRLNKGYTVEEALTTPTDNNLAMVNLNGEDISLVELSKRCGISRDTLYDRIFMAGWDVEKAISTPVVNNIKMIEYNGDSFSCSQWDRLRGYKPCTVSHRLQKGYTIEEALNGKDGTTKNMRNAIYFVDDDGKSYSDSEWLKKEEKEEN